MKYSPFHLHIWFLSLDLTLDSLILVCCIYVFTMGLYAKLTLFVDVWWEEYGLTGSEYTWSSSMIDCHKTEAYCCVNGFKYKELGQRKEWRIYYETLLHTISSLRESSELQTARKLRSCSLLPTNSSHLNLHTALFLDCK